MKLWSVVKLATIVSVLFSANVLAAGVFNARTDTNEPNPACHYYMGMGSMYHENDRERPINYTVTLKVVPLADGRDLLDYNLMVNGQTMRWPMIVDEESDAFQKVFVPNSVATMDDYASYVETGWAHQLEYDRIHQDEGTPKKITLLFNFIDQHGNRVAHHVLAYRISGKWQLTSTGSIGNANGVISVWAHKLSQADSCYL